MRNHSKLKAFQLVDKPTLIICMLIRSLRRKSGQPPSLTA